MPQGDVREIPEQDGSLVSRGDLEALLGEVKQQVGNPNAGIFGSRSVTWKINRESAVFLGAGRAALLQLAHPWVAAALAQHSTTLADPIARFHQTFRVVFTMVFGTVDQALAASRQLYARHTGIRGEMPEPVAGYTRGSHYEANERAALGWVYATLVESAVLAHEFVMPLSDAEREQYYSESKQMAALFGIDRHSLPEDWTAFARYSQAMVESDALGVNDLSRSMGQRILEGAGSWVHPPRWYRGLTAFWMPARLREEFALDFGPAERRSIERARTWFPRVYRKLPENLRLVGPFHEATARLADRPVNVLTRCNNRFWMGQPRLMFSQHEQR